VAEVTTPEAVPIGDLDESAIRAGLEESKRNLASATAGSAAAAVAQISIDTYAAMLLAVGKAL
jgi:F0F1-type ATP synthase epsilon subunit